MTRAFESKTAITFMITNITSECGLYEQHDIRGWLLLNSILRLGISSFRKSPHDRNPVYYCLRPEYSSSGYTSNFPYPSLDTNVLLLTIPQYSRPSTTHSLRHNSPSQTTTPLSLQIQTSSHFAKPSRPQSLIPTPSTTTPKAATHS